MDIAGNQIYEHSDGTIEIVGSNGYVVIPPAYRKELAAFLSKRIPRIKCIFCGTEGNKFECVKCQLKHEEESAPKFHWQVFCNGKQVNSGKTSRAKAYTEYTTLAYLRSAKHWNGEYYENDQGDRFTIHFGEPKKRTTARRTAAVLA